MRPSARHPNRGAHNWLVYRRIDQWLSRMSPRIRGVVIDLGAGDQPYRDWVLQRCDRYIAVDWDRSIHRGRPDLMADLNGSVPLPDAVADSVLCLSVLEHLHSPAQALAEARRMLKRGGHLVLEVPFQWRVHEAPHDYFRYTPMALQMLLQRAGFEVVSIEASAGIFAQLALKLNYLLTRLERGPRSARMAVRMCLSPVWYLTQLVAMLLEPLDRHPEVEAVGYFVCAEAT